MYSTITSKDACETIDRAKAAAERLARAETIHTEEYAKYNAAACEAEMTLRDATGVAHEPAGETDDTVHNGITHYTEMDIDALGKYFSHMRGQRRTAGGGKKPRVKAVSLRAAIRRKLKQRAQKRARKNNRT